METALTVVRQDAEAYEPRDLTEALRIAEVLVKSKLLPAKVATQEQAFVIMATGKELGLTAMQSLRSIHVIDGKPSCSADLLLALCKREPRICKYFRLVKSDEKIATYETHREDESRPTSLSFTIDEAKQAGLTGKDNWRKYPAAMLRARCIAALARAVYPDLVLGIYETDEMESRNGATREIRVEAVDSSGGQADNVVASASVHDATASGTSDPSVTEQAGEPRAATGQSSEMVERFSAQLAAAESLPALDALVSAIKAARASKAISEEQYKALGAEFVQRKAALAPAPSEPTQATAAA